jgi:hypothetical protein
MKWRGENNRQMTRDFMRELHELDRDIVWRGWVVEHSAEYQPPLFPHQDVCVGRIVEDREELGFFVSFDCSDTLWVEPKKAVVDWGDRGNQGRLLSLVEKVYGAPVIPLPSPGGKWLPFKITESGGEVLPRPGRTPTKVDCLVETLLCGLAFTP